MDDYGEREFVRKKGAAEAKVACRAGPLQPPRAPLCWRKTSGGSPCASTLPAVSSRFFCQRPGC